MTPAEAKAHGDPEGRRKRAAWCLRKASEQVQHALRIATDYPAPVEDETADQIQAADVILRALARILEHHGQNDLFGGVQPIIPNEPFRSWNDRGQPGS